LISAFGALFMRNGKAFLRQAGLLTRL